MPVNEIRRKQNNTIWYLILAGLVILLFVVLVSINDSGADDQPVPHTYTTADNVEIAHNQIVYVPVNWHSSNKAYSGNNLKTILKVRNTSMADSIYITGVRLYDNHGDMVQSFLDSILIVKPMATYELTVGSKNYKNRGDNFIVAYGTTKPVQGPIIQTLTTDPARNWILKGEGIPVAEVPVSE